MTDTVSVFPFWDMKPFFSVDKDKRIFGYINHSNPFNPIKKVKIKDLKKLGKFISHIALNTRTATFDNGTVSTESSSYFADITPTNETPQSNKTTNNAVNVTKKTNNKLNNTNRSKNLNNANRTSKNLNNSVKKYERVEEYFKNYEDAHNRKFENLKKQIYSIIVER